jgi:SAM-dependent methyltransferase
MLCGHAQENNQPLFEARDYITGDAFTIQKCLTCGLALTLPFPSTETMGRYYPETYFGDPSQRRFPWAVEKLQRYLYDIRARRVETLVMGPGRRVLDVGCGKGFLLEAFRRRGWKTQGVESSDHSARHGREVLGLDIHVGSLHAKGLSECRFEAAVLWHVLEHFQDPGRLLKELHDLLEPGGVLLVSVPDFGCPESRLTGPGWFHLDVPRHLVHFTRKVLVQHLKEAGFEVAGRIRYSPEYDLFSFVQSSLNRLGLPPNHAYRMLRGRGAKLPDDLDRWWHAPASLGLGLLLGCLGLLWIPLAGWLGMGSTQSYLAKRLP